jgi:hypothetical protein
MRVSTILVTVSTLALAACGGGGSSSTGAQPTPTISQYSYLSNQQLGFALRNPNPVATAALPVVGTASYQGVATFSRTNLQQALINPDVAAQVNLYADFGGKNVQGTMQNIVDRSNTPISGSLGMTAAPVTGNTFQGTMTGTLVDGQGTTTNSVPMAGTFIGPNAESMIGGLSPASNGPLPPFGLFTTERVP